MTSCLARCHTGSHLNPWDSNISFGASVRPLGGIDMTSKRRGKRAGALMQIADRLYIDGLEAIGEGVGIELEDAFHSANAVLRVVVEKYIHYVGISWHKDRDKNGLDSEHPTLKISYGQHILIPLPYKFIEAWGLTKKVNEKMYEQQPQSVAEANAFFSTIENLPEMPAECLPIWRAWYEVVRPIGTAWVVEDFGKYTLGGTIKDFSYPKLLDSSSVYKLSEMGKHFLYDKKVVDAYIASRNKWDVGVQAAVPAARQMFNEIGFSMSNEPYLVQEEEVIDETHSRQVQVLVSDRDLFSNEFVAEAYFRNREEWMLEDMRVISQLADPAIRADAWRKAGIDVVAEASYVDGTCYQRIWRVTTTVLKGGAQRVDGSWGNKQESLTQHSYCALVIPEPVDSIIFVVDHEGGDLDNYKFSVIDREALKETN